MKKSLIDTDILSYFLKGDDQISKKVQEYLIDHNRLIFSDITYFEILSGLEYKQAKRQINEFKIFASKSIVLKLTEKSLQKSAKIYGELRRQGIQIGTPDLLIAGLSLEVKLDLITNNVKHYQEIKGLTVKNWKN